MSLPPLHRRAGTWMLVGLAVLLRLTPPWEIHHDCGWYLYLADRVLAGAGLYSDIVEVNPPAILYLTLPPAAVASLTGWPMAAVFDGWVLLGIGAAVLLASRVEGFRSPRLSAMLFFVLAVVPGADFGQREHLAVFLSMPFFAVVAGRLGSWSPSRGLGLAVGGCAAVGFALKPHFLLAPVAVHLGFALARRRPLAIRTPENLAVAVVLAAYGVHFLAMPFCAVFVDHVALVLEVYGGFRITPAEFFARPWVRGGLLAMVAVAVAMAWWWKRIQPRQVLAVALLAQVGFFAAAGWQGKGWTYHLLPVLLVGALGLVVAGFAVLDRSRWRDVVIWAVVGWGVLCVGRHELAWDPATGALGPAPEFTGVPADFAAVRTLAPGQSVVVWDTDLMTFFAYLGDHDIRWASRHACLWVLPGAAPARRELLRKEVLADLDRFRPELLYVRRGRPPFVTDPDFDLWTWVSRGEPAVLSRYQRVGGSETYLQFRRRR